MRLLSVLLSLTVVTCGFAADKVGDTRIAKWKTTIQMVAIAFLLAGPAGDKILPYTTEAGIVLLWIAAGITLYTGYDYFRAGLKHVVNE